MFYVAERKEFSQKYTGNGYKEVIHMCGFLKPKMPAPPDMPAGPPEQLKDDAVTQQKEEERRRRGYSSTLVTGGMGVADQANIRKKALGE